MIAFGALPLLGQRGIVLACAILTLVGLALVDGARRAVAAASAGERGSALRSEERGVGEGREAREDRGGDDCGQ